MKNFYTKIIMAFSLGLLLPSTTQATQNTANANICNDMKELLSVHCVEADNAIPVTVKGLIYFDKNHNNSYDANNEPIYPGALVELTDSKGLKYMMTTNYKGYYHFTHVTPGEITISITGLPAGAEAIEDFTSTTNNGTITTLNPVGYRIYF